MKRWGPNNLSIIGQVAEFAVWTELTAQSAGALHVFLPIWDRGVDAVIHRRTDDTYIALQVKSRSALSNGAVSIVIADQSLTDDAALIVATLRDGSRLGPRLLVIDEGTFKTEASHYHDGTGMVYAASFHIDGSETRWAPYIVERDRLAERLGVPDSTLLAADEPAEVLPSPDAPGPAAADPRDVGILGEAELVRRLVENPALNLFRPFPDMETVELVVRHLGSGRVTGLQVKTVGIDDDHPEATISIRQLSFRPSPTTWLVVLAWVRVESRFHPDALLVPSTAVASIAYAEENSLRINYRPGSPAARHLAPYRTQVADLAAAVGALVAQ